MAKRGKQYRAMAAHIDRTQNYSAAQAVELLKKSQVC
jgi:ribosomal protein L1